MKKLLRTSLFVLLATFSTACNRTAATDSERVISVSIPPLKFIVSSIVGDDFVIETLLPSGVAPESYSPTVTQLLNLEDSELLFTTGLLDFEQQAFAKTNYPNTNIINLCNGMSLISDTAHNHGDTHGNDPHVWMSPVRLKEMAASVYEALQAKFPDSVGYQAAYAKLIERIDSIHMVVQNNINRSNNHAFIVYHPALSYFAEDYGLTQLAIENDGKEPSAAHLRDVVQTALDNDIQVILYQSEFPLSFIKTVARDTGAVPVEFNPLSEDILTEILNVSKIISGQ